MDSMNFDYMDPGMYLYGMFYAAAFMMAAFGMLSAIRSIKGLTVPLAIAAAIALYGWLTEASFASF